MEHGKFVALWAARDSSKAKQLRRVLENGAPTVGFQILYFDRAIVLFNEGVAHLKDEKSGRTTFAEGYLAESGIHTGEALIRALDGGRSDSAGAFSSVCLGSDSLRASTDYLGSRQLYHSPIDREVVMVSNDLFWHGCVLRLLSEEVQTDFASLGVLSALGAPLAPFTGLRRVSLLRTGHELRLEPKNSEVSIQDFRKRFDGVESGELYRQAAVDIQSHLRCAREHFSDREHVMELTGGMDSRLVYAAALSLGDLSRYSFFCRGKADEPEKRSAGLIIGAFGQTFGPSPYSYEDVSEDAYLQAAADCGGMRTIDDVGFFVKTRYQDRVVHTGGLGETFRNFYVESLSTREGFDPNLLRRSANDRAALETFKQVFLQRRLLYKRLERKVVERIEQCLPQYELPFGQALRELYCDNRNRFHYGLSAAVRMPSLPCFQVLTSQAAVEASRRLSAESQADGTVNLKILEQLFPALLCFPYAFKAVPKKLFSGLLYADYLNQWMSESASFWNSTLPPTHKRYSAVKGTPQEDVRASYIRVALSLSERASRETSKLLNLDKLVPILKSDDSRNLVHARHLVGPLGWAVLVKALNEAPVERVLSTLMSGHARDILS
jgi:hypothetical protein